MARSRNYSYTLNNFTPDELTSLKSLEPKYHIIGNEVGENGTPHLQGYISFSNAKTFTATKKILGPRVHLEASKGTGYDNFVYCSKQKIEHEYGTRPEKTAQGKRNDMEQIHQAVQDGTKIKQMCDEGLIGNYQQLKYAETLNKYYEKRRTTKPTVKWFYGATGTGKTKTAYEEMEGLTDIDNIYVAMDTGKWWDGYDGQEYIIIDDMRGDFMKFHQLLKLLDRYAYRVETKGSTRQFLGIHIIITSAYPPNEMFQTREDIQQLLRRIDEIRLFE